MTKREAITALECDLWRLWAIGNRKSPQLTAPRAHLCEVVNGLLKKRPTIQEIAKARDAMHMAFEAAIVTAATNIEHIRKSQ